jgi:flagellar biosynthesis protein FlhG
MKAGERGCRNMSETRAAGDDSESLRRVSALRPVKVIAVTSGKGGVGKTNVSVNLSVALAAGGREVLLMDADLGLANIDVMLGLPAPQYNLSHVLRGERTLEQIIVPGPGGIRIVPASSGAKRMAELTPAENAGVIRAFGDIGERLDVMIIDTAAGISDSVISFSRASQEVLVVVCDEPASINDAYALIKLLSREYGVYRFRVLANMGRSAQEAKELFAKISRVADRFLDVMLDFVGWIPYDEHLRKAVQRQRAVVEAFPRSPAAAAFKNVAQRTDAWPVPSLAGGHLEFFIERLIQADGAGTEHLP